MLLSIDPGQTEHGYVITSSYGEIYPLSFCKANTSRMVETIRDNFDLSEIVIEKPICRKWAGREVSDTAIMAGYLAGVRDIPVYFITRSKVRGYLKCTRGGDKAIKTHLVNMFAPGRINYGKGSKANPGFFYGFKSDIWQAFALAVVFRLMRSSGNVKDIDYLEENRIQ